MIFECFDSAPRSERTTQIQKKQLAALEASLTLEEVAHFRVSIAAKHSRCINGDPAILSHAFHAVDAIISNLGAPSYQPV